MLRTVSFVLALALGNGMLTTKIGLTTNRVSGKKLIESDAKNTWMITTLETESV